jgi:tRNA nucleotidyltransferase (CCA-adding enzyme)
MRPMIAQAELPARLRALPGMDRLLPALGGLGPCFLVGGAVRDLLLGAESLDLDVAVEGDAERVARQLADRLGGRVRAHDRFGTATVTADGLQLDLATTRRERYAAPGALPDVEPAGLDEDLGRRDFTVNAMAVALADGEVGTLRDPHGGRADLEGGLIRVLHPASFVDDPTRLLRAVRYAARFGFLLESETEDLARAAIAGGAPATVSGPRIRAELLDLLAEAEAPAAVELLRDLGLGRALDPVLRPDPELVAAAKLGALETGADPTLAALAALCADAHDELEPWVERLDVGAAERDAVLRAARRGRVLADELTRDLRPSQVHALLMPEPPEALALALALGAPGQPVLDFVARLRRTRLEITGADLLAAGVPESPALGRALELTLARKLDGELDGRDDELRAALELAREQG